MKCRQVVRIITDTRDKRLSPLKQHMLEAHVMACRDCARAATQTRQLRTWLAELDDYRAPPVFAAIEHRLLGRKTGGWSGLVSVYRLAGAVAAAILTGVAIYTGMWAGDGVSACTCERENDALTILLSDVAQGHEMESCLDRLGEGATP